MHNQSLREIREYLDSVPNETEASADNRLCYEVVEDRAISILDSRFSEFEPGLLEEYLLYYMMLRRYEYSLVDLDCPDAVER